MSPVNIDGSTALLCAVLDGHSGSLVASHVSVILIALCEEVCRDMRSSSWEEKMTHLFQTLDRRVKVFDGVVRARDEKDNYCVSGACIALVIVTETQIISANAGDSMSYLKRGANVVELSMTHDLSNPLEIMRISRIHVPYPTFRGNNVRNSHGDELEPTRVIGDFKFKVDSVVICDPFVNVVRREPSDEYICLFSDGLGNDLKSIDRDVQEAFRFFTEDDITCIPTFVARTSGNADNLSMCMICLRQLSEITKEPLYSADMRLVQLALEQVYINESAHVKNPPTDRMNYISFILQDDMSQYFRAPSDVVIEPHVISDIGTLVAVHKQPYIRDPGWLKCISDASMRKIKLKHVVVACMFHSMYGISLLRLLKSMKRSDMYEYYMNRENSDKIRRLWSSISEEDMDSSSMVNDDTHVWADVQSYPVTDDENLIKVIDSIRSNINAQYKNVVGTILSGGITVEDRHSVKSLYNAIVTNLRTCVLAIKRSVDISIDKKWADGATLRSRLDALIPEMIETYLSETYQSYILRNRDGTAVAASSAAASSASASVASRLTSPPNPTAPAASPGARSSAAPPPASPSATSSSSNPAASERRAGAASAAPPPAFVFVTSPSSNPVASERRAGAAPAPAPPFAAPASAAPAPASSFATSSSSNPVASASRAGAASATPPPASPSATSTSSNPVASERRAVAAPAPAPPFAAPASATPPPAFVFVTSPSSNPVASERRAGAALAPAPPFAAPASAAPPQASPFAAPASAAPPQASPFAAPASAASVPAAAVAAGAMSSASAASAAAPPVVRSAAPSTPSDARSTSRPFVFATSSSANPTAPPPAARPVPPPPAARPVPPPAAALASPIDSLRVWSYRSDQLNAY